MPRFAPWPPKKYPMTPFDSMTEEPLRTGVRMNSKGLLPWLAGLAESSRVLDEALAGRSLPRYVLLDSAGTLHGGPGRTALSSAAFFTDLVGRVGELGFTDAITHWPRPAAPYAAEDAVLEEVAALLPTF